MKLSIRHIAAALSLLAIAASPALAQPGHPQSPRGKAKGKGTVMYIFKGTWNADGTVTVTGGNAHVRKHFLTQNVLFDLSEATLVVADTDGDHVRGVKDITAGDKVLVQERLPRKDPGDPSAAKARKLVDQTHPPAPALTQPEQD